MDKRKKYQSEPSKIEKVSVEEQVSELTDANKRLKRKIFDLNTIFEISIHLNSMLDSDQLLDGILLTSIGQMGVSGAAILLAPAESVQAQKSTRMPDDFHLELACTKGLSYRGDKFSLQPNRRLYHLMLGPKRPLAIEEVAQALEMRQSEMDKLKSIEAALIIPMILKNQVRGIMTMTEKIAKAPFQEHDFEFLSTLANQLAVAVENSRLYQSEKEAHRQLAVAQKRLLDSEKMAALGKLSASIAHEINNPLGIMKNYLLILELDLQENSNALSNISVVKDEADRIGSIIKQLLDFYRPGKKVLQSVDIEDMIKDTVDVVRKPFEHSGIDIELSRFCGSNRVTGTSEQLRQVLINLLVNAKESMPDGGKIEISSSRNKETLIIRVSDSGPGIPQEIISRIFEPFFTTKEVSDGIGLGLSVSYSIIKNHGGDITVVNNEGSGSTFTITLPLEKQIKGESA